MNASCLLVFSLSLSLSLLYPVYTMKLARRPGSTSARRASSSSQLHPVNGVLLSVCLSAGRLRRQTAANFPSKREVMGARNIIASKSSRRHDFSSPTVGTFGEKNFDRLKFRERKVAGNCPCATGTMSLVQRELVCWSVASIVVRLID